MEDGTFKIRSYGWTELALCYHPSLQPESASRLLHRWVKHNPELTNALVATGLLIKQRKLTPKQVETIVSYLGEP